MVSPSPYHRPDAQKKSDVAVEVPIEVLGAASASKRVPPVGAETERGGFGKSSAFKAMASLAVAGAADALEVAFPPAWLVIDACATTAFFLIWGLRWEIAVVLVPELIPGMNVFPSWTLLALYLGKKGAGKG
jgi:hypothetical protein